MNAPAGSTPGTAVPSARQPSPGRRAVSMVTVIWRSLTVFVLLMIGAGVLIFLGIRKQNLAVDRVVHLQPLQVANAQLGADFAGSQAALHAYIDSGETRFLQLYRQGQARLAADFAGARALASGPERQALAVQQRAAQDWFGYAAQMRPLTPRSPGLTRLLDESAASARTFNTANTRLRGRLQADSHAAITSGQQAVDRATLIGGLIAAAGVLLAIIVATATARSVAVPLRGLTATLRRLGAGDLTARATVAGAAETREAAVSLNGLADEASRMREREAERSRLAAVARSAGLRIREHLRAEDVLGEARAVIERELDTGTAYLHLIEDGTMSPPLGHETDWVMPPQFLDLLGSGFVEQLRAMFQRRRVLVVQDLTGPEGEQVPPDIRELLLRAGIVAQVIAPFGVGADLLGTIVLSRTGKGHRWTPAEIDAVESIATDLGRGLHHARMYEAENQLVTELQELDRMKSDFLATVSHELRTPLTSIAGFVELLRDKDPGPLNHEQEDMLGTIERNTARLRHLIEDVLTLSKIESRAFKTSMQPVNLAEVTSSAVAALQPEAAAHGLSLTLDGSGILLVSGDPGQLDRMIINLLSNAVKFTPAGGQVDVSVARQADMAVITVSDTGIGIPERDQKDLFTRFFRASNATEHSIPGTGLGLTIVHAIVTNHGGDLTVRSREGAGTTVIARIPLLTARGVAIAPQAAGQDEPQAPPAGRAGHGTGPGGGGSPPGHGPASRLMASARTRELPPISCDYSR